MNNDLSINKEITGEDFDILQRKTRDALNSVYNFGVHNLSPKGSVKKEMQEIYDLVEAERKLWKIASFKVPCAETSSLILKHMRNIVKLGTIHEGLVTGHLMKLRRAI